MPSQLFAIAVQDESWDASDGVGSSGLGVGIDIDVGETYMKQLFCSGFEMRRQ